LTAGAVPPVEGTAPASAVVDGPGFDSALSRRVVDTATRQWDSTIAEGIAIADPARRDQILAAVAESGGDIVAVSENEIRRAQQDLAGQGFYVEPTSAVCWAAVRVGLIPTPRHDMQSAMTRSPVPHTVIPLCGSGLKT
jgi:threonine synthase